MEHSPFEAKTPACAIPEKNHLADTPTIYRQPPSLFAQIRVHIRRIIAIILGRPDPERLVPVTILTGFLGAGKTTLIINLLKDLPAEYRVAWLKNEFGNTAIDSELAADNNIAMVKEMLQGCICHVLVGQLGQALDEMLASNPDRIIIETSGSAAPAPIVWEIRKHPRLIVDGVITVIDAINFPGYKDKSYTAKLQARYTDLILINKHEGLSEIELDRILDDVYELNPDAPKIQIDHGRVDPSVAFGLDSRLFETIESVKEQESHINKNHQHNEVELAEITFRKDFTRTTIESILAEFPKTHFYRIKGVVVVDKKTHVLNWAFGTFQLMPISRTADASKIIFMGTDIKPFFKRIAEIFSIDETGIMYTPKEHHHDHNDHDDHDHGHDHHAD
jgi:G3E family GTPase